MINYAKTFLVNVRLWLCAAQLREQNERLKRENSLLRKHLQRYAVHHYVFSPDQSVECAICGMFSTDDTPHHTTDCLLAKR